MIIDQISIRNFRAIDAVDFQPGFLNVVLAGNGRGKSSFGHALGYALSGKCPWVRENGEGMTELVRKGADECSVTLGLTAPYGEVSVCRAYPPHRLALTGTPSNTGPREAQAALNAVLGCTGERARLSLDPSRWFGLAPKDRTGILSEILGLYLDNAKVLELLQEHEQICGMPLVAAATALAKGPITNNFGKWEALFKNTFTDFNRELKSAKERQKAAQERLEALVLQHGGKAAAAAPEQLAKVREELKEVRAMLARHESWQDAVAQKREAVASAEKRLADILFPEAPSAEQVAEKVEETEKRLAERQRELDEAQGAQAAREQAQATLRNTKAEIQGIEATLRQAACPTCAGVLTDAARATLDQRRRALFAEAQPLIPVAQGEDRAAVIEDLATRVQRGTEALRALRQRLQETKDADSRRAGERAAAEQNLKERQLELDTTLAQDQPDEAELRAWIAGLEEQESALAAAAEGPAEVERVRGEIGAYEKQIGDLERRLKVVSELKHWFGPSGIQRRHLEGSIEPVQENVNAILARWGMEARYEVPTLDLTVRTPGSAGKFVAVEHVSHSEWIRTALAHQVFLAASTGIRIIVVDDVESLDAPAQAALFDACEALQDQLDHVFLLAVALSCPPPDSARILRLDSAA